MVKRLKEDAEELDQIIDGLRENALLRYGTRLPRKMKAEASFLASLHESFTRGRPAVSGRNRHLFYLAELVSRVTGDAHFEELAELVNAIQPNAAKLASPESLQKKVARFEKADRKLALSLRYSARGEAEEWKQRKSPPQSASAGPADAKRSKKTELAS